MRPPSDNSKRTQVNQLESALDQANEVAEAARNQHTSLLQRYQELESHLDETEQAKLQLAKEVEDIRTRHQEE